MRLLSRHILRTLSGPYFWGLLALTGLLLLNSLATLINEFGGRNLTLAVMVEIVVLALPALLVLTMPMAVLVAALYGFSTLAADLEMMAMYASGVSVWRLARPAIAAAVLIGAVDFVIFDQVVPLSNTRYRTLRSAVQQKQPTLALKPQQLNDVANSGYVLKAQTIAPTGGLMHQVTIWDLRFHDGRRVIRADSGRMAHSSDGRDLMLTLYDGEVLDFSASEPGKVERTDFLSNRVRVVNVANELERDRAAAERGDREKSGCELLDGITERQWQLDQARSRRERLTRRDLRNLAGLPPLPPPAIESRPEFPPHCGAWRKVERFFERLLLPAPLGAQEPLPRRLVQDSMNAAQDTSGVLLRPRRAPVDSLTELEFQDQFEVESLAVRSAEIPQDADSLRFLVPIEPGVGQMAPRADGMVSAMHEITGARLQYDDAQGSIREFGVEYHKKFALPLAAICFVLLGLALALKVPGGGIGLVIGGSLLIFLTFYVLLIGGENLGDNGYLPPVVAMYVPVITFTILGLLGVAAANRELGSTRGTNFMDSARQWFARLTSR